MTKDIIPQNASRKAKCSVLLAVLAMMGITTSAQNITGSWKGELDAGLQKIPLTLHLTPEGDCTLDSPMQGAEGIPANVLYISSDSLSISIPSVGASYSGRLEGGEIRGLFTQNGFKLPLHLKPGKTEFNRPQTPQPPYPYSTEEVTFTNAKAGATLAGTLTLPEGAKCVLLMVTGSGPQNRDEEIMGHKPFAVIADRLARAGIATLRYDDRATGKSIGGMAPNATTQDFADDAAAGIEWLRKSGGFERVGILGHSEGGTIAFMLGARKTVDFIVSMAGTAVRGDSVLLLQNKTIAGEAANDLTTDQLREMPAVRQSSWMQWFLDYDPQQDIAKISCPVFALNGSKDCQVIASQNLPALRRTLPKNELHVIKEYPQLNHLFQHCQTGLPDEYGQIEETISEEVVSEMASWIQLLPTPPSH